MDRRRFLQSMSAFGAAVGLQQPAAAQDGAGPVRTAPAPLFVDPVYDGAADPAIIWNAERKEWWIFYTQRRANQQDEPGVRWCHGTDIGIAVSSGDGFPWRYKGIAEGLDFEDGRNTFWAPEVIRHEDAYHMYVSYIRGLHDDWSGDRHIVHYTSGDLLHWRRESTLALSSARVIDPCVYRLPDGRWRMWYKDEAAGSHIYSAGSTDLFVWRDTGPVIADRGGEAPNVFQLGGAYWMLTDSGGLNLYRSEDLNRWTYVGPFLQAPGARPCDGAVAQHPDALEQGDHAYLVYFVHPFGARHTEPGKHRSVLQIARLCVADGQLIAERDEPFRLELIPPA